MQKKVVNYSTPYGTVELQIPLHLFKPGIICSGGADSSLLLYLLLENGIIPTVVFMLDANSSMPALKNVVAWMENNFKVKLNVVPWTRRLDTGHDLTAETVEIGRQFQYLYTGVTAIAPSIDALQPWRPDPALMKRNVWRNQIMPFASFDKRIIAHLYSALNLEALFEITYSCATNLISPCGKCYNCLERAWALSAIQ